MESIRPRQSGLPYPPCDQAIILGYFKFKPLDSSILNSTSALVHLRSSYPCYVRINQYRVTVYTGICTVFDGRVDSYPAPVRQHQAENTVVCCQMIFLGSHEET